MDGDRARPDLSSLAKVSMQTDLAENLQEFNSIETERNAIYLLTWLANKPLQGADGGALEALGELACQVEKSGITRSGQAAAIGWMAGNSFVQKPKKQ